MPWFLTFGWFWIYYVIKGDLHLLVLLPPPPSARMTGILPPVSVMLGWKPGQGLCQLNYISNPFSPPLAPEEMDNLNSLAFQVLQDLIYHHWQEHRGTEKRNQVLYSSDFLAKLCRSKLTTLRWRPCFRWSDVSWCDVEFWEQSPLFDVRLVGCGQYLLLNSSYSIAPLVNPSAIYHCFKVMSTCTQGHSCLPSSSFSGSFFRGLFYPSSFVK